MGRLDARRLAFAQVQFGGWGGKPHDSREHRDAAPQFRGLHADAGAASHSDLRAGQGEDQGVAAFRPRR